MNEKNNRIVTGRHGLSVWLTVMIVFVIGAASFASAEIVELHGTVTIDGQSPNKAFSLRLVKASKEHLSVISDGRVYDTLRTNEDGTFSRSLDVTSGEEFFIMPGSQSVYLPKNTKQNYFYSGYAEFKAEGNPTVQLNLQTKKLRQAYVKAVDELGTSVSVAIRFYDRISLGTKKDSPHWGSQRPSIRTDPNGIAAVAIVEGSAGTCRTRIHSRSKSGDIYIGETVLSYKELARTSVEDPLMVKVKRIPLSAKIKVMWDPGYSQELFRHDVYSAVSSHTLEIKGDGASQRKEMRPDGMLRYFDLKPGRYTVSFLPLGRKKYTITSGEEVVIPVGQKEPVESILTVVPTKHYSLRGIIVDDESGEPVAKARLTGIGRSIKTDQTGEFKVEIYEGMTANLAVEHSDYFPQVFDLSSKRPEDLVRLPIKQFPALSGKVVYGKDKTPAAFARLGFGSSPRSFDAYCNEQGEYSIKLPAGEYQLSISIPIQLKKREHNTRLPKVEMFERDKTFTMGKTDKKKDFKLKGIGSVTVQVSYSKEDFGDKQPKFISLLREKDNTAANSSLITEENKATIYAPVGKYKIAVAPNDDFGIIAGNTTVTEVQETETSVTVEKWKNIRVTDSGGVEFYESK